ncbi:MAG: hypothetical protein K6F05_00215 [Succinivibrio sp.]|nr:hypothetical protein [Succinivibrio sp.]
MGKENISLGAGRLKQLPGPKPIYNHVLQSPFTEDPSLNLALKVLFNIKAHKAPQTDTPSV